MPELISCTCLCSYSLSYRFPSSWIWSLPCPWLCPSWIRPSIRPCRSRRSPDSAPPGASRFVPSVVLLPELPLPEPVIVARPLVWFLTWFNNSRNCGPNSMWPRCTMAPLPEKTVPSGRRYGNSGRPCFLPFFLGCFGMAA